MVPHESSGVCSPSDTKWVSLFCSLHVGAWTKVDLSAGLRRLRAPVWQHDLELRRRERFFFLPPHRCLKLSPACLVAERVYRDICMFTDSIVRRDYSGHLLWVFFAYYGLQVFPSCWIEWSLRYLIFKDSCLCWVYHLPDKLFQCPIILTDRKSHLISK